MLLFVSKLYIIGESIKKKPISALPSKKVGSYKRGFTANGPFFVFEGRTYSEYDLKKEQGNAAYFPLSSTMYFFHVHRVISRALRPYTKPATITLADLHLHFITGKPVMKLRKCPPPQYERSCAATKR